MMIVVCKLVVICLISMFPPRWHRTFQIGVDNFAHDIWAMLIRRAHALSVNPSLSVFNFRSVLTNVDSARQAGKGLFRFHEGSPTLQTLNCERLARFVMSNLANELACEENMFFFPERANAACCSYSGQHAAHQIISTMLAAHQAHTFNESD